ncbi:MAG: hypothetical protein A3G81_07190 [Betaproteobacteria bacterium RIFCSPLOWO2_12_FULL_65_14]|nr:MAG: hypothetical protein A3G81_07190 [Betaproteobacteria bacterium RIFCSPLOWO2_12_FULL_65_14]
MEERYRGIYPIRLYRAKLAVSGAFDLPPPPAARAGSVRGIKEAPPVRIGERNVQWRPGALDTRLKSGLHASLGGYAKLQAFSFQIALELAGTGRLDIAPLGERSEVSLVSTWPHPSFVGAYPPERRDTAADGFAARWRVNHLATGGKAFWLEAAAGDKLFSNARLLGVALVELVWRVALHPVQYALTGLALAVFFLLLIALSEHIRFGWAYLAAAASCVALLGFYLRHALGTARSILFTALFATLAHAP